MKKTIRAVVVGAIVAGSALGAASSASATENWAYQGTRVVQGANVFVYSNSGGTRYSDTWQGLIWNGDVTYYVR